MDTISTDSFAVSFSHHWYSDYRTFITVVSVAIIVIFAIIFMLSFTKIDKTKLLRWTCIAGLIVTFLSWVFLTSYTG